MDEKVLGTTVRIDLTTHDSTGALVAPSSAFASDGSDFRIYKDGSAAQKTTQNGITVTSPFDSIVGKHLIEIDTSNSTGDSGFWAAGSEYRVEINSAKTVASIVQSGVVVGRFTLVAAGVLRPTTDGRTLDVSAAHAALSELDSSVTDLLNDIPTTAEFQARTLASASYATASQINSLQVNTRASVQVPVEIETPDSGTQVWKIRLFLFDSDGNMEAPDSTPAVALVNASGTDRSSRLSAATTLSTGAYSWDYTATDDDAEEQINWTFTVVEGGLTRIYPATSYVVEETAYRFTSSDRSTLNSRASSTEVAAVNTKLGTPAGASVSADIASIKTDTGTTIPGRFTTLTTKILKLFQLGYRKDAAIATDNATELTELNASGGSGAGSYSNITDAQEAIRDRGDAAWTTGSGGNGGGPAYSAAVVAARLPVGAAAGWPQEIVCGSAYLTELGTHVPLYVKDVDDNILAAMGDKTFSDGDFKAILRLSPLTDANKLLAQPAATIEVDSDDTPGIVFNDDTSGEEYFELQIPKAKTVLGEIRTRYLCQVILRWGDGSEYEWIVNLGESKFIRGVSAAA